MSFDSTLGGDISSEASASEPDSLKLLSVIVPAFDEEKRLGATLKRMLAYFDERKTPFEILVVDDGSQDGTGALVETISGCRSEVRLLSYKPNRGKGYAVRYGMMRACGERILFSDADLATPIEEIENLSGKLDEGYQIAIGSRDVVGSQLIKHQSWFLEQGGKTFNKMVQALAVPGIHDTQCGFKLFTKEAALSIFSRCQVDHFAFDVEVLYLAIKLFGFRVVEVPVRWAHQEGSKVVFLRDAFRMAKTLFKIRMTNYGTPESSSASIKLHPR